VKHSNTVIQMRSHMKLPAPALATLLAAALTLIGTTPQPAQADDTDLYLNPNAATIAGLPLVMFDLDYRTNLGNVVCTNASLASCDAGEYFRGLNTPTVEYADVAVYMTALGTGKMSSFDVLKMSLNVVFTDFENFKGGLMVPHANVNNCAGPSNEKNGCSNGAYILQGFTEMDPAGRTAWLTKFNSMLDPGGTLNHSYQLQEVLFEFYRYIKGWEVYNGRNGYTDWGSGGGSSGNRNVGDALDTTNNNHLLGWDSSIMSSSAGKWNYSSPFLVGDQCTKLFFIHFLFGTTSQEDDSAAAIKAGANSTSQGMGLTSLSNGTTGAVQMVSYMKNNDLSDAIAGSQTVTQYFVTDATSTSISQLAAAGGTTQIKIEMDDPSIVVEALRNILREIISTSTTFVAASVPVNVFNRSESLNNVFIALFQVPDPLKPVWIGNVKKLKFGDVVIDATTGETQKALVDVNEVAAIADDGRIKFDALTFWTVAEDLPAADISANEYDLKDGRVVDRGAMGQKIPGFLPSGTPTGPGDANGGSNRKVFYDPATIANGTTTDLLDLDATATLATALQTTLGAATDVDALEYLKFMRGQDTKDADGDLSLTESRDWLVGDPLHSRPLPINYGLLKGHTDETNPLIYIAIGTNDGSMRLVRNSVASDVDTDHAAGEEAWAFYPRAVMGSVKTLYDNDAADSHPYMVDGAPASLTLDFNGDGTINAIGGTDKVYLYFGLRRGGRTLYGMDITDPDTPKMVWRIDESTTGFAELGFSFAQPRIGQVNVDLDGDGKAADYVLFVPGGYDPNKDTRGVTTGILGTDDTMGNSFFVINAKTGALVWKAVKTGTASSNTFVHASLTDSIPSDPAVLDSNGDGFVDRVVIGDTGGQVWRFDLSGATTNWRATLLANLGRGYSATIANDLRFFHRPDVVPAKDASGSFDAVVIGSGDRENPLDRPGDSTDADTHVNYMFMIRDTQLVPYNSGDTAPTPITPADLSDVTAASCALTSCVTAGTKGWKFKLEVGVGEKSLSAPLTISNTAFFTTYLPATSSATATTCAPSEGTGAFYAVNLADATVSTNFNIARDGGDPSENTARSVQLTSAGIPADVVGVSLDGQTYVLPPDLKLSKVDASTRWRTFWYEVQDDDGD
jgi:type IV pilus assembly protein PilY1